MPLALAALLVLLAVPPAAAQRGDPIQFSGTGRTVYGDWRADVELSRDFWRPDTALTITTRLQFPATQIAALAAANIKADKVCLLVTAERTFDSTGWMRLASDERMSTLLTPAGLAIEGGVQGAVTNRYGYGFKSPLDQYQIIPIANLEPGVAAGTSLARFTIAATLPANLPPGLYRLRFDFGVAAGSRVYNFNGYTFASRPFSNEEGTSTYFYSPVVPASGPDASGRQTDATRLTPRCPWLLLASYNSNGYRGVVADEDRARFATSDRSLIPDEVILPMYDDNGNRVSYSLEPQFPTDTIDPLANIRWDWSRGELAVRIAGPDGSVVDLGRAPIVAKAGNGPTTKKSPFTAWRPQAYGRYVVTTTGWILDADGRRYEGGGTYRFWIAKRMTLATATFQGMPYPVGATYGRDIQFNPPVPATVNVTATLYVNSDPGDVRTTSYSGTATAAGLFGAAQGLKPFPLSAPGEYHAQILATYTDADGHLWVSTMRHAGIVYTDSGVIARGKKLAIGGKYVDRGDTRDEGYIAGDGTQHLSHITFPYNAGDVLLIAAEGQGANKIEPVLTYQLRGDNPAWDTRLNSVGTTNLSIKTSNGYSPHLFPEYITDVEYYYGAAPRPGFMGRFLVGESNVRAPYWPVSPNSFGGQIGASPNGDAPGDIYRLIGGVVLRRPDGARYAGYIASAFLLPPGSNDNRVVAAGSEDLNGPLGAKARFFLVGLRPGTAYELGSTFRPAVQIDPLLPVAVHFVLTYPDGRRQTADGVADQFGSFAGATAWPLDVAGVYRYELHATWSGFAGGMPGLPDSGGEFYVYSPSKPAGASGLTIDGSTQRTFSAASGITIGGTTTATSVHYALITPGAVIDQGELRVNAGRFQFVFDPAAVHAKVPLYDIVSITSGRPQIGRVVHLTFFSQERTATGSTFFDFARVILRGTTMIAPRTANTRTASASPSQVPGSGAITTASSGSTPSDGQIGSMIAAGELRVVSRELDSLLADRVHERLQQYHRGVPVWGADLTRQLQAGRTVSLFGRVRDGVDVDPAAALDRNDARAIVERSTGGLVADDALPALAIVSAEDGRDRLSWYAEARSGTDTVACFIDAATGRMLLEYSNRKAQHARVLDAGGDMARAAEILVARAPSNGSESRDGTAEAHARLETAFRYLLVRFGRSGVDGHGAEVTAIVRPADPAAWGQAAPPYRPFFVDAFWDGRAIVFGAGVPDGITVDGRHWRDATRGLDVAAHELAHAVIDSSSRLIYRNESGALAEAFADIVATGAARFDDPARTDGVIGEAMVDGGLRSIEQPSTYGDAEHYNRRYVGPDDNGGVHRNSTIASHAFALAADRTGTARRALVEQVFYRAFVYLLPSDASFATARAATLQSARDLGADPDVQRAIADAWDAVGVTAEPQR